MNNNVFLKPLFIVLIRLIINPTEDSQKTSTPKCENCQESGASKLQLCAVCKRARYCSKQCQKSHWRTHKNDCKRAREKKVQRQTKRFMDEIGDRLYASQNGRVGAHVISDSPCMPGIQALGKLTAVFCRVRDIKHMSNDKSWDVVLAELARVQQRGITNQIVVAFADINNRCYQMMSHTQEAEQTPKTLKRKDPEHSPLIKLDMQSFRIPDSPSFDCVKSVVRQQIDDVAYRNHTELLSFAKRMYKKKGRGVVVCYLRVCSLENSQKPKLSLEPICGSVLQNN
jgi:hypothetical protein